MDPVYKDQGDLQKIKKKKNRILYWGFTPVIQRCRLIDHLAVSLARLGCLEYDNSVDGDPQRTFGGLTLGGAGECQV